MDDYARAAHMTAKLTRAGGVLDYGPERSRLVVRVLRTLALGRPVTQTEVDGLALEAGMAPDEGQAFLREVSERDGADRIIGIVGLSLGEHPHRFSVNGRRLATCAPRTRCSSPRCSGRPRGSSRSRRRVGSPCTSRSDRKASRR